MRTPSSQNAIKREKVTTTNFTTSKTKKNKFVNHHYIENGFLVDHYYYNQNIENGFLVDHYIENHCLLSSSLLQKSECRKECEKNIKSLSFCLIFTLTTYGISTYGVLAKKNFKLSNLT
jgi:hypothetical protein